MSTSLSVFDPFKWVGEGQVQVLLQGPFHSTILHNVHFDTILITAPSTAQHNYSKLRINPNLADRGTSYNRSVKFMSSFYPSVPLDYMYFGGTALFSVVGLHSKVQINSLFFLFLKGWLWNYGRTSGARIEIHLTNGSNFLPWRVGGFESPSERDFWYRTESFPFHWNRKI